MCRKCARLDKDFEEEGEEEYFRINVIRATEKDDWFQTVTFNNCDAQLKLDSGAQYNVISLKFLNKVKGELIKTTKKRLITFPKTAASAESNCPHKNVL
jgi:hypothetical protein